jgi:hypothetical protein
MSAFRRWGILLALISMILVGCRGDEPEPASWLSQWETMIGLVPDQSEIATPPDKALCRETLSRLREVSAELDPAPSPTLTDLVNEWVSIAEATFFGCPPESEDITSFEQAYDELERIEESVDTALANAG